MFSSVTDHVLLTLAGEPKAPVADVPPQADDQLRNQDANAVSQPAEGQKVKSEKECMYCPDHALLASHSDHRW